MRKLFKFLKGFFVFIILLVAILYIFDYDYMLKAVRTIYLQGHTTAFLEDYQEFDNNLIDAGIAQPWPRHNAYNSAEPTQTLDQFNKRLGTVAYLIIKNDSLWYESYADGFGIDSKSNSFSMAKSMVTALLGKAIMEGKIKSLDQPVTDFFPEFGGDKGSKLTVGDLASMSSGLEWDESYYSPFSITTRAYFYDDLDNMMLGLKVTGDPGTSYKYLSGNTQLLGMVIEKASGKSLSQYLSESFWKPMGAEHEAFWQVDSEDNMQEKAYCCVASNARDFARFGKLYKNQGNWKGMQLLDSSFVQKSVSPRFQESPQYGYGWWLLNHLGKDFFMMRGHLGQYVIVQPEDDLIIVRLGHKSMKGPDPTVNFSDDIYIFIEEAYAMMNR